MASNRHSSTSSSDDGQDRYPTNEEPVSVLQRKVPKGENLKVGKCNKDSSDEVIGVSWQRHQHRNPVQDSQQTTTSTHQFDTDWMDIVENRLWTFTKYFVQEFETKTYFYHFILEGRLNKAGKFSDTFAEMSGQASGGLIGGLLGLLAGFPAEGFSIGKQLMGSATKKVGTLLASAHYRRKARKILDLTEWYLQDKAGFRRLLVHTACDVFHSYEMQLSNVNSMSGPRQALHSLAKDAVNRSFDYFLEGGCFDLSTAASQNLSLGETILKGNSKIEPLLGCILVYNSKVKTPGCDLHWESNGLRLRWKSSSMFGNPGLVVQEGFHTKRYFTKKQSARPYKYGYRRLLLTENWNRLLQEYVEDTDQKTLQFIEYQFSLRPENLQEHCKGILERINETDPMMMEQRLQAILQDHKNDMLEVMDAMKDLKNICEEDHQMLQSLTTAIRSVELEDILRHFEAKLDELAKQQRFLATSVADGRTENLKGFHDTNEHLQLKAEQNRNLHDRTHAKLDVLNSLVQQKSGMCSRPLTNQESIVYNLPPLRSIFVGREEDLKEVHDAFHVKCKPIVVISGMRGVGKSQLARKYSDVYYPSFYSDVVWIDASSEMITKESFIQLLADKLCITTKNSNGVQRSLRCILEDAYHFFRDRRCLLVLDDALSYEAIGAFLPTFLPSSMSKPFVLVTSANSQWTRVIDDVFERNLKKFSSLESGAFVRAALRINGVEDHSPDKDIEDLAAMFDSLPLALGQAVAYIRRQKGLKSENDRDFTIRDFIRWYIEKPEVVLTASYNEQKTILQILALTIEGIQQEAYGKAAMTMLRVMAYFASANIPEVIFLQELAHGDKRDLKAIVDTLERYSLVQSENSMMTVHGLVQDTVRLLLKEQAPVAGQPSEEQVIKKALVLLRDYVLSDAKVTHICQMHLVSLWKYTFGHGHVIEEYVADNIEDEEAHMVYFYLCDAEDCHQIMDKVLRHIRNTFPQHLHAVVHKEDPDKYISLHLAADNGHLEMARLLLEVGGANMDAKTKFGWRPIHLAVAKGHKEMVRLLLDNMAHVITAQLYSSLLFWAVQGHLVDIARMLIEDCKDLNVQNSVCEQALHQSARLGFSDICTMVLDKGTNVNIRDKRDFTPLCLAAARGHKDVVKLLLDKKADVNMLHCTGLTALHLAVQSCHTDIIRMILDFSSVDVNMLNLKGESALHLAAWRGHLDICKILLDSGANVNSTDARVYPTMLPVATDNEGHSDREASAKVPCAHGFTPLHVAVMENHIHIVKMLVTIPNINLNMVTAKGSTALHLAAEKGHLDIYEILLAKGADANVRDADGKVATELLPQSSSRHQSSQSLLLYSRNGLRVICDFALKLVRRRW